MPENLKYLRAQEIHSSTPVYECLDQAACRAHDFFFNVFCKCKLTIFAKPFVIHWFLCPSITRTPASGDFCPLLITFANSLDPDQDGQTV